MPQLVVTIEICRGLRSLEFECPERTPGASSQASVEFARQAPLPPGKSAHIPLGLRGGRRRALIGVPKLVGEKPASSSHEYLYRITGLISELPPDYK